MKEKAVIKALQSGRQFAPKGDAIVTLRVTVYDADNTRHETVVRLESDDLARMGDELERSGQAGQGNG